HHGAEVGLDDERLTELLHDDHVLDRAAAQAAQLLRERRAQDAQLLGEGLPDLRPLARLLAHHGAALLELVVVRQVRRDRVAQHRLFFGEAEIHSSARPSYDPLIPANAGTQIKVSAIAGRAQRPRGPAPSPSIWVPAFAGMSGRNWLR